MSKIKKIIYSAVIVILMLILVQNTVQADETRKYFSYTDLCLNETLLCAQHHQSMFGDNYKLIGTIDINGDVSTGNGKTVENSWDNAYMAAILSNKRGQGNLNGGDVEWLPVQNAIWSFLPTWINKVGKNHGIPTSFASGGANYTPNEILEPAKEYADNYKNITFNDKTDKNKLSAKSYKENNEIYLRVGPFKYEFSGNLSDMKVATNKSENVGITKIEKRVSAENYQKYSNIEEVKSGDEIYLSIKAPADGSEVIKSVTVTNKTKKKHVIVKFWQSESYSQQNLLQYEYDEDEREIPFKFDYNMKIFGHLKVIKVDEKNQEVKLPNVTFYIKNKELDCYVKQAAGGKILYVRNKDEAKLFKTDENGEININNLIPGTYVAYEENNPNYGYIISKEGKEKNVVIDKTAELKILNTRAVGKLKVIKVDANNYIKKLPGVGFYIRNEDTKKYVKIEGNSKEVKYVDSEKEATEFITNPNGEIEVNNLIIGTYKAYETKNPNKGYEIIKDGFEKKVEIDKTAELIVENKQKYIKLSGYVFKDIQSQKQSIRNDLYKADENDYEDKFIKGVEVRLKYIDKEIAKTRTTAEGKYVFENVEISKLADYSIEFDYYGLIYENVELHLDKYNGSKATEGDLRTEFNNKFTEITKDTIIDDIELTYNKGGHKSTLNNANMFTITSTTKNAKLNLEQVYQNQNEKDEIKNINLGLYEREQPDLAVVKDIENVKLAVNGYEHTYKYASRYKNASEYIDGFNVGVKFGEEYGEQSYSRPVYKADYDYINSEDKNKELKAYITYKIAIGNKATSLTSKVNSLVDYYDSRYQLVAAGTEINEEDGTITGTKISHTDSSYNDKYIKAVLNTDLTIDHNETKYIYVQFSMNRETIFNIIQGKELLDNVVEINSYTTYKTNGNGQLQLYAGVDKNSRPGNAIPGDKETYEDDTDKAPALLLEWAEARKITGTVFEDSVKGEIKAREERLGNGMYDEEEKTIQGVEVKLVKEDGSVEKSTVTDENGNFELEGFIPGRYTLVYTWGDETSYPVTDYKGTIYVDKKRFDDSNKNRSWYAENVDTRYSDAIDNYETRGKIDSGEEITTMDSRTPVMEFGIEWYDTLNIVSDVDQLQFLVKNIDFGIVERPRQKLDISKEVTAMKTTVGDNIVLVDVVKDDKGEYAPKVDGSKMNFTAPRPEDPTQKTTIKEEIDDDILNNTTVQIEYTIKVTNNSELDYNTEDYYIYGVHGKNDEANEVVLTPTGVYDYLDKKMALDPDNKGNWEVVSSDEYLNKTNDVTEPIIDEYMINSVSTYNNPDGSKIEIRDFISYVKEYYEVIEEWEHSVFKEFRKNMAMDRTILRNSNLEESLQAGKSNEAKLYTSTKLAATADNINFNNSVEITKVENNTTKGRKITPRTSKLFEPGEEVIITPPQGKDHDYVLPIALGISLLAILGAGVILIKKKVLNK